MALVELWASGVLPKRKAHEDLWDWLATLPWTRRTRRRGELRLVDQARADLEALLFEVWPDWEGVLARLRAASLRVDAAGWRLLREAERADRKAKPLPPRLNQRTAAGLVAASSKAELTEARRELLGPVDITRDGVVRLRPHAGLQIEREGSRLAGSVVVAALGEVCITERALRDGTHLGGTRPRAVLLVENVGAYLDLTPPAGWMVAQVPGWNTATARVLLEQLQDVPLVHFGDLDPNGVRIANHVRAMRQDVLWFVPAYWEEFVQDHAQRRAWPDDLDLAGVPPLVSRLAREGLWLEQEPLAVDPRFPAALARLVSD